MLHTKSPAYSQARPLFSTEPILQYIVLNVNTETPYIVIKY